MSYKRSLIAAISLTLLAGCSSSGGDGSASATLAAPTPPIIQPVQLSPAQNALQNLPGLNTVVDRNAAPVAVFNSDGTSGNGTINLRDDGSSSATINGETFEFPRNSNSSQNFDLLFSQPFNIDTTSGGLILFTEIDENINSTNVGFLVTGRLTELNSLPASATYSGEFVVADTGGSDPEVLNMFSNRPFEATATFGETNTLTGTVNGFINDNVQQRNINADITGNTFSGTVSNGSGDAFSLDGGFFGVDAASVVGSGAGVVNGEAVAIGLAGNRTDNVPTN